MQSLLSWSAKKLQAGIVAGVLLGLGTPIAAMVISSHRTEAAVAVFDQKNIEEAIKTAIQTANILTTEQKELALKILDAKKLDASMLADFVEKNKEAQVLSETNGIVDPVELIKANGKIPSILNKNTTTTEIFRNEIGTIEDAMTGKKTLVDLYLQTQKNHQALDATYQAAAERAQAAQNASDVTRETVNQAVDAANHAEGQQQLMQSQVSLLAASALQQADIRDLLAQSLAMEAQKWYIENNEKAQVETRERAMGQNFAAFTK